MKVRVIVETVKMIEVDDKFATLCHDDTWNQEDCNELEKIVEEKLGVKAFDFDKYYNEGYKENDVWFCNVSDLNGQPMCEY